MNDTRNAGHSGRVSKSTDQAGLITSYAAMRAAASTPAAAPRSHETTPEERRLEDLKQMAAYRGPVVSFEVREPYYLASCDHCGWVGSSELCGTSDADDVHCPRCHSAGADCGKVAAALAFPGTPESNEQDIDALTGCADDQGLFAMVDMDENREAIRRALYDGLRWVETLPEPNGDVPALYSGWDDLGDLADRIIAADAFEASVREIAGRREEIRQALYDGLCRVGTLPEPQGDVPMRYHRWDDLGELADRIIAMTPAVRTKAADAGQETP